MGSLFTTSIANRDYPLMTDKLLELDGLTKYFYKSVGFSGQKKQVVQSVDNVSFHIQRNVAEINEDDKFFYQSVSHGLKTPIMVIQNCCAAFHDGIYGAEAVDIIMKESLVLEDGIQQHCGKRPALCRRLHPDFCGGEAGPVSPHL